MTRQLSTMVSSGMSLLRALYVLEDQAESDKLKETLVAGPQGRRGRHLALRRALRSTRRSSTSSTRRWWPPARPAASWRARSSASPTSSRRTRSSGARSSRRWSTRALIGGFALLVLVALVAFLVPVFAGVFEDFGGELPAITKFTVALSDFITGKWYMAMLLTWGVVFGFRKWKASESGRMQWDQFKLQGPVEDRRHRPEGLHRALLAHLLGARRRRRADARGDRHRRQDLRQQGDREGDGRRARLGHEGRHDLDSDARRAGVPDDGHADDRRGRGDRRPRRDDDARSRTSTSRRSRRRSRR